MSSEECFFFFKGDVDYRNNKEKQKLSAVLEADLGIDREKGREEREKAVDEQRPEKRRKPRFLFVVEEESNPADKGKENKNLTYRDGYHRE